MLIYGKVRSLESLDGFSVGVQFLGSTEPSTFPSKFGYLRPFGLSGVRFRPLAAAENTINHYTEHLSHRSTTSQILTIVVLNPLNPVLEVSEILGKNLGSVPLNSTEPNRAHRTHPGPLNQLTP